MEHSECKVQKNGTFIQVKFHLNVWYCLGKERKVCANTKRE